jgi:hypothetical protein
MTINTATVLLIFTNVRLNHGQHDWRGAIQPIRSMASGTGTPVLVVSRFVEVSDPAQFANPKLKDILFALLVLYPPQASW